MEIIIIAVILISFSIAFGLVSRHKNQISHFFGQMGKIKASVFLVLSALFIYIALKQDKGAESIILPTFLGLVLNGLIFTIIFDYLKLREREIQNLEKLRVMEEVIGNTVYYFQSSSLIDFTQYRDGRLALHKVEWKTVEKIASHYKTPGQIKEHELKFFHVLGTVLKNHSQVYSAILSTAYSADHELIRIWTEIVFSNEQLSRELSEFKELCTQFNNESVKESVVRGTGLHIYNHFEKLLAFNAYQEKLRRSLISV